MIKHLYTTAECVQEQAFVHKYPVRDPSGWQDKALKYKPGCSSDAYDIAMGPLVSAIVYTAFFHLLPNLHASKGCSIGVINQRHVTISMLCAYLFWLLVLIM